MANYKIEIGKRYGMFHAAFFEAAPGTKAPSTDAQTKFKNLDEVLKFVRDSFLDNVDDDDSVIFRGIAYTSLGELEQEVRRAPY